MSQPRLVPVRSAFGTFIFACLFIAHLIVVLRMVEAMPLFRNDEQVYLNLGAYGLSFAISLLSGLCLVSSAYTKHYFKVNWQPYNYCSLTNTIRIIDRNSDYDSECLLVLAC